MTQQGSTDRGAAGESRALVVIDHPDAAREDGGRPLAQFVAQLIACRRGLAPFRKARRAEPGSARLAYGPRALPTRPMRLDVSF